MTTPAKPANLIRGTIRVTFTVPTYTPVNGLLRGGVQIMELPSYARRAIGDLLTTQLSGVNGLGLTGEMNATMNLDDGHGGHIIAHVETDLKSLNITEKNSNE